MSDHLKKVKSGDALEIPATTFNTFIDAARKFQDSAQGTAQRTTPTFRRTGIFLVKNISGSDCGRFGILGIDGPIFTPTDNEDEFKNRVALKGNTPDESNHVGKFVILLEPVQNGQIGLACVNGVCPVKVDVTDTDHQYADIDDGQTGDLNSGDSGAAQILWAESGTGEKWVIVRVGMPSHADEVRFGKVVSVAPPLFHQCSEVHPCDKDGSNEDTGTSIWVYHRWTYNFPATKNAPLPQFIIGDVIAYVPISTAEGIVLGDWILPRGWGSSDQYKVLQYDNGGNLVKDYVRAHG